MENICLQLTGLIRTVTSWMLNIPRFLKSISALIFLELANGNFAAQPNNRILWHISSFTTGGNIPDYTVQTTEWNVENSGFITDDTDKMFYDIKDKK
jgi:hypothetical protein